MIRFSAALVAAALAVSSTSAHAVNCKKSPWKCDSDLDGLNNQVEAQLGTSSYDADSDDDTLTDGVEVNSSLTNPLLADTDADGWDDAYEWNTSLTDATLADTDGDSVNDPVDAFPHDPLEQSDLDDDGIGDQADPDDDGNCVDDVDQVFGGASLDDLGPGTLLDVEVCAWSLMGDPTCEPFTVEIQGGGVMVETAYGITGEYEQSLSLLGTWSLVAAFPTLDMASLRMNGAQVDPGGAVSCYAGPVEALGGWYEVGGDSGSYWFATGHFTACVN